VIAYKKNMYLFTKIIHKLLLPTVLKNNRKKIRYGITQSNILSQKKISFAIFSPKLVTD
jgi:hypothetical protein